jgi:hypothetical protein
LNRSWFTEEEIIGISEEQGPVLKKLETDNARPRLAVSDLTLDKMFIAEAAKGTSKPPAAVPVWIMSPQNWACPNDGHAGFSTSCWFKLEMQRVQSKSSARIRLILAEAAARLGGDSDVWTLSENKMIPWGEKLSRRSLI